MTDAEKRTLEEVRETAARHTLRLFTTLQASRFPRGAPPVAVVYMVEGVLTAVAAAIWRAREPAKVSGSLENLFRNTARMLKEAFKRAERAYPPK